MNPILEHRFDRFGTDFFVVKPPLSRFLPTISATDFSKMNPIELFKNRRVLIVGDLMVDRYLHGSVSRISPEAPVPVVHFQSEEKRLGGAGNVALNVLALGGLPMLCSVVGTDESTINWLELLENIGLSTDGILFSETRKSTVKTRIVGNHQQMLRIDREDTHDLDELETDLFLQKTSQILDKTGADVLIFQDYNKGVLTQKVIEILLAEAQKRGIPTAVDPKKNNFFSFRGATLFKPNLKEIGEGLGLPVEPSLASLARAAAHLREKLGHRTTMITLSEQGIYLENDGIGEIYPTQTRQVADVSGAGDTVISVAALGLAAGLPMATIARLSNLAGGQVCQEAGVVPVNAARLLDSFLARPF